MKKQGAKVATLATGDKVLDYGAWTSKYHYAWAPGYSRCRQSPYNPMYTGYANPYRNLRHADDFELADPSYYSAAAAMANASPRGRLSAKIDAMSRYQHPVNRQQSGKKRFTLINQSPDQR